MAASPGVRYGATPEATSRQPRPAAAAAASRRSRISSPPASSRPVHTPVVVSTWNRISSCRTPGSPPSIRTSSGPPSAAAPVDGSSSTNSSSTPSVTAPGARTVPGGPPGTVAARPAPPGPGTTTTTLAGALAPRSGSGRSGSRWPSALASPAAAWAARMSGHSIAASVTEAAACTAAASAAASVRTCPAAFRAASSGCPAGIGTARAIAWSFLPFRARRESPAVRLSPMAPKGAR